MKIGLIGYGKMGKAIEKIASDRGHEIVCKIDASEDLPALLDLEAAVAIEFTQPTSAFHNVKFCLDNQLPVISGTTGWLDQLGEIKEICKKNNGTFLYASNFSIGVNLFFELNEWLAAKMSASDFETQITEVHHTEKKDSPSGTAITLAEGILKNNPKKESWVNTKTADHKKLGIISERKENVPGTHTVTYASHLESIEIVHTANDRSVFAEGAVKVAEWIYTKKGVYTMSDFINN